MKNLDYREYYRRNLPHIQPRGATFLVNFRLAGSLPSEIVKGLREKADQLEKKLLAIKDPKEKTLLRDKEQQKLFDKWDDALHESQTGPFWLRDDRIAQTVANSILYHDGNWFDMLAYCIMPNHANKILERTGAFWQHENYDHFARDEAEVDRIIKYVLYNPVRAKLVKEQTDWKWSYSKFEM